MTKPEVPTWRLRQLQEGTITKSGKPAQKKDTAANNYESTARRGGFIGNQGRGGAVASCGGRATGVGEPQSTSGAVRVETGSTAVAAPANTMPGASISRSTSFAEVVRAPISNTNGGQSVLGSGMDEDQRPLQPIQEDTFRGKSKPMFWNTFVRKYSKRYSARCNAKNALAVFSRAECAYAAKYFGLFLRTEVRSYPQSGGIDIYVEPKYQNRFQWDRELVERLNDFIQVVNVWATTRTSDDLANPFGSFFLSWLQDHNLTCPTLEELQLEFWPPSIAETMNIPSSRQEAREWTTRRLRLRHR
jgi:hypothetical protein